MKEIEIEDLKVGIKVKLKTFEECNRIDIKLNYAFIIYQNMKECFGKIHTIAFIGEFYRGFYISIDGTSPTIYHCKWIEEIIEEEETNNKGQIKFSNN